MRLAQEQGEPQISVNRPALLSAALSRAMLTGMANTHLKTKSKRHWLQFSMRNVLLCVTLLCVALSVWVMPHEQQRRAVATIESLGGRVTYVVSKSPSQPAGRSLLER
jgi:hypothetical protein